MTSTRFSMVHMMSLVVAPDLPFRQLLLAPRFQEGEEMDVVARVVDPRTSRCQFVSQQCT